MDTARTETTTLSLHDALPILFDRRLVDPARLDQAQAVARLHPLLHEAGAAGGLFWDGGERAEHAEGLRLHQAGDRKSTRLNSSHRCTSYAFFRLKKKKHQAVS